MQITRRGFISTAAAGVVGFSAQKGYSQPNVTGTDERINADVVVIGAGAAGFPAALAAARCGANVVLIEEDMVPGGAAVDFFVSMPCGNPIQGIYKEMIDLIKQKYSQPGCANRWFLPSSYVSAIWEMAAAEKNLRIMCGARAVHVLRGSRAGRESIEGVIVQRGAKLCEIRGYVTIDATGTGVIAQEAGCDCMYGTEAKSDFNEPNALDKADNKVQMVTWQYISQRIGNGNPFDMTQLENVNMGVLDDNCGWFHSHKDQAIKADTGMYLHWGCALECADTRDDAELAQAQRNAYDKMKNDLSLLRQNGYAVHLAPKIGVREVRRVRGEYVIKEQDLRSGKVSQDSIAFGTYGIDLWGRKIKGSHKVPGYGIPYMSLVVKDREGFLTAGKIISGTHIAMAAYRVQPIVSQIGQSAGIAAAMAAKAKCGLRNVDIKKLQQKTTEMGLNLRL
jgi:hypothetical protein